MTANESIDIAAIVSREYRGRMWRAEFCPDGSLVGEGDGLENKVEVGKVREVDIPDVVVGEGEGVGVVEVEGGVNRLEGIGIEEVSDGMGELREPVISSMVKNEEYWWYGPPFTGLTEVKFT